MSDPRYKEPDPVRWFDALGTCKCGKAAHGRLMGPRNESYGVACTKCAAARLKAAQDSRVKHYAAQAPAEGKAATPHREG